MGPKTQSCPGPWRPPGLSLSHSNFLPFVPFTLTVLGSAGDEQSLGVLGSWDLRQLFRDCSWLCDSFWGYIPKPYSPLPQNSLAEW